MEARALGAVGREARLEPGLPGSQPSLWCPDQQPRLESARERAEEAARGERIVANRGVADRDPDRAEAALEDRRIRGAHDRRALDAVPVDQPAQVAGRAQA